MFETVALTLLLQAAGSPPPITPPQSATPPFEGHWSVEAIDTIKVMPESHITMRIEGHDIAGSASCNNYRGTFTVDGARVRVGELLRTMKLCDGARLSEEHDFLTLLRQVVSYEVQSRDILQLKTSDGKTIVAKRAE
jgi:heat shock protein HslJ